MGTTQPRTVQTSNGPVRIRIGVPDDVPAILDHRRHMAITSPHNVTTLDEIETDPAKVLEWINDHTEKPGYLLIVADQPEATTPEKRAYLLGALSFRCGSRRRIQHHGDFGISVVEEWRGKGIGRALIQTLIDWAASHEFVEKIYLGVFEDNIGARRLYHRMGFQKEAIRRDFFKMDDGRYVNDILMSRWVKPRQQS